MKLRLPFNCAHRKSFKAKMFILFANCCNPTMRLPCFVFVESVRVGNDTQNYHKLQFINPFKGI